MNIEYRVVDVFTQTRLEGNPLAVFPKADELDAQTMQKIARELNLSETAFILPAEDGKCAARVRIFTPASEMRFAGHPTVGSAHVMRETGWVAPQVLEFCVEEGVGPVPLRIEGDREPLIWLRTPPIRKGDRFDRAMCAALVGLDESDLLPGVECAVFSAGNPNLYIAVREPAIVDRAQIDTVRLRALQPRESAVCVYVFAPRAGGAYSRMFAPELGVVEDPATGSAAGPLVAYMIDQRLMGSEPQTHVLIEQGTKIGRRSFLHALTHGTAGSEGIEVGGHAVTVATATMILD